MPQPNKLIVLTAPSGAGKTTIVRHLLQKYPDQLAFSVSATTRPPRDYEKEGLHYYFISLDDFRNKVENDEFVEYEEVYSGTCYGTLKSEISRLWKEGKAVVFDIDVEGAKNIKRIYGDQALTLFIMPPSIEVLRQRLEERGTESNESLNTRVAKFQKEMDEANQFDVIIINDDLHQAFEETDEVVEAFLNDNQDSNNTTA